MLDREIPVEAHYNLEGLTENEYTILKIVLNRMMDELSVFEEAAVLNRTSRDYKPTGDKHSEFVIKINLKEE